MRRIPCGAGRRAIAARVPGNAGGGGAPVRQGVSRGVHGDDRRRGGTPSRLDALAHRASGSPRQRRRDGRDLGLAVTSAAYRRAVAAIDAVAWRGVKPGLERTEALLAVLGMPQAGLRGVLVAGTNGKGSVCAIVDSVCRAAGVRTVLLTKPHLHSYCERIVRDGAAIDDDAFGDLIDDVGRAAADLPDELRPTGFELLTAAGILAAARAGAEALVCEVGMGGRLDSTNVLDLGVAVVTNVALDHQEFLGATVTDIAREKAAIIKPGNRVITGAAGPALDVIRERAAEAGAALSVAAPVGRAL